MGHDWGSGLICRSKLSLSVSVPASLRCPRQLLALWNVSTRGGICQTRKLRTQMYSNTNSFQLIYEKPTTTRAWICWITQKYQLRIPPKFDTALPSTVCPSVRPSVHPSVYRCDIHISPMYIGIYAICIISMHCIYLQDNPFGQWSEWTGWSVLLGCLRWSGCSRTVGHGDKLCNSLHEKVVS